MKSHKLQRFVCIMLEIKSHTILLLCLCITISQAQPYQKHNKKYLIEVQDHQQAMKYADPMADLEDTVRRGINDPLNDSDFFMNKVNEDYFHRNFQHDTSTIFGGLLPRQSLQTSLHSNARLFDLTPQRALQDNAVKDSLVSDHISPYLRLKPLRPRQENAGKSGAIPRPQLSDLLAARKRNNNINQFIANKNNDEDNENINPLTGLPDDLEAKSLGGITSIQSISDQGLLQPPQSVTVDLSTVAAKQKEQKASHRHLIQNSLNLNKQKLSDSPSLLAGALGSNYNTIKSFLEADDILRTKLNNKIVGKK